MSSSLANIDLKQVAVKALSASAEQMDNVREAHGDVTAAMLFVVLVIVVVAGAPVGV